MGIRWSVVVPWCIAAVALVVLVRLTFLRWDLNIRREEWRRASVEAMEGAKAKAACAQLRTQVAAAERESDRARAFLRQDLLVPRAILALESARPRGMGIDSVTWRTEYFPAGPCIRLDVNGWAATPVQAQATQSWIVWVQRLSTTAPWEVSLKLQSGPSWSRRGRGTDPSLAFRASFQTRPTPIPPK